MRTTWSVLEGDALALLPTLPDATFDAVVTDPPYGIAYETADGRSVANDARPFYWWLHSAARLLKPVSCLVCFCRWDVQERFRQAIEDAGLDVRSQVVWDRVVHGQGDTSAAFGPQHDVMWFATRGRYSFPGARPKSIIQAVRPRAAVLHPTEKPVDLMVTLLRAVVPPFGQVLDPFCGSGSTGVAARQLGMSFMGIELDSGHAATARRRLAEAASLFESP